MNFHLEISSLHFITTVCILHFNLRLYFPWLLEIHRSTLEMIDWSTAVSVATSVLPVAAICCRVASFILLS
jgi:hypothetical protein